MIAFDAAADGYINSNTALTYSHTCTGANILWVGVHNEGVIQTPSSVTYAAVSMSLSGSVATSGTHRVSLWYLVNPASGANNVVITEASSANTIVGVSASYKSAKLSGIPDSSNTYNSTSGTSAAVSTTTIADNCFAIMVIGTNAGGITAGANTIMRTSSIHEAQILDSNGPITPAGLRTLNANFNSATDIAAAISSFVPGPSGFLGIFM